MRATEALQLLCADGSYRRDTSLAWWRAGSSRDELPNVKDMRRCPMYVQDQGRVPFATAGPNRDVHDG